MRENIKCDDNYEAQKLASLIHIKEKNETFITGILDIIENEIIITIKDKSAHSILFKNKDEAERFANFIQSVIENTNKIENTVVHENVIEITKE